MRLVFASGLLLTAAGLLLAVGTYRPGLLLAIPPGVALAFCAAGLMLAFAGRKRYFYCARCGARTGDTWNDAYACQRCGSLVCSRERTKPSRAKAG